MRKARADKPLQLMMTLWMLLCLVHLSVTADVITVGPGGDYDKIQDAMNAAGDSDELIVSPGTYVPNLAEFWVVQFQGKNITLRSTDPTDPEVVKKTILDAQNKTRVVLFNGDELSTCTLAGFTITGGMSAKGGGIVGNGTHATISNNHITTNGVYLNPIEQKNYGAGLIDCDGLIENNLIANNNQGGGITDCDGVITGNIIERNSMTSQRYHGGGLYNCNGEIRNNIIRENSGLKYAMGGGMANCDAIISGNTIVDNFTVGQGGGVFNCSGVIEKNLVSRNSANQFGGGFAACKGIIQNNIVTSNTALLYGGGFYNCTATIRNNTIFANQARDGGGLAGSSGIVNCIIWGNSSGQLYRCSNPTYSWVQTDAGGVKSTSQDPGFVNPGQGDFHLEADSPCIDAGSNQDGLTDDFEGNPRPLDGVSEPRGDGSDFDIGVFEYYPPMSLEMIRDHILARLKIPTERRPEADQNNDTGIDVGDMIKFLIQ